MVKKFTLLELHLDDARFSNAIGRSADDADAMLDGMEMDETDMTMDATVGEMDETGGRGLGRTIGMLAFAFVLALGVRSLARRVRTDDVDATDDDVGGSGIEVDLDEPIDA